MNEYANLLKVILNQKSKSMTKVFTKKSTYHKYLLTVLLKLSEWDQCNAEFEADTQTGRFT